MKGKLKGYDPNLGKTFAQSSDGFVLGRGKSSAKKSATQEDLGQQPPQEAQDDVVESLVDRLKAQKSAQ